MIKLLLLVPLLPLLGFLINGIFGKYLTKLISGILGCTTILISFIISVLAFLELNGLKTKEVILPIYDWIQLGAIDVPISLFYDPLSAIMILIITGVGFLIHWYSTSYMQEDEAFLDSLPI